MINDKYLDLIKDEFKESYLLYKQNISLKAYSSHQPVLIHVLNTINKGPVLEYGTGFNSTPLLHVICALQNRNLLSLDNEEEWLNKFTHYKTKLHQVELMKDISEFKNESKKISIAFIDGGLPRQPFIELLKDVADYIIVHDTEGYIEGKKDCYKYDFSGFKHVYHYKNAMPMTSLLSNLKKIDPRILTIFE